MLQGIQHEQSGRTLSDRPCLLHHASMLEKIKVTTTICKHIYLTSKVLHALAEIHGDVNMHCKKSVDFTVKYGNLAASSFTVIFTGVYL